MHAMITGLWLAGCAGAGETEGVADASAAALRAEEEDDDEVRPRGCVTEIAAGHSTFECEGPDPDAPITYEVEVPEVCVDGGCGLVLDVHGGSMNGNIQDMLSGMRAVGRAGGFLVVQPTAPTRVEGVLVDLGFDPRTWYQADLAEVDAVHRFVQDVLRSYLVDRDDVHVTGFSQGGWMTWHLLCSYPQTFASGAPVSFGAAEGRLEPPRVPEVPHCFEGDGPYLERPILWVHGRQDGFIDFDLWAAPLLDNIEAELGLELVSESCYAQPEVGEDGEPCPAGTVSDYQTGKGTDLQFIAHELAAFPFVFPDGRVAGGHCYPGVGASPPDPDGFDPVGFWRWLFGCGQGSATPLGETLAAFFEDHPRDDDDPN